MALNHQLCETGTTELHNRGLAEEAVYIGDRFRAGSAEFVLTQPRMPCFKLGIRFNRPDMVKRFLESGRTGFYCAVLKEGKVAAGDSIELLERDQHDNYGRRRRESVPTRCNEPRHVASRQRTTLTAKKLARVLS